MGLPSKEGTIMQYTAHLRSYLIINCFRYPLCDIKQIMTSVYILSCFMPFLKYRNNEIGPLALFLFLYGRKGIKQDRIYTLVIICILHYNICSHWSVISFVICSDFF